MKRLTILGSIFLVALLTSCGGKSTTPNKKQHSIAVSTVNVNLMEISRPHRFSGTVHAEEAAQLSSRIMGTIQMLKVKSGDSVRKGETLVKINDQELLASLKTAQASLKQVEAKYLLLEKNYGRMKRLLNEHSITQGEFDKISMELEVTQEQQSQAKAQIQKIQSMIRDSRIVAPFDGVITNKYQQQGSLASPGRPILSMANSAAYNVEFFLPEKQSFNISKGDISHVMVRGSHKKMEAKVTHVTTTGKDHNGQVRVIATIQDHDTSLLGDGIYATVDLPQMKVKQIMIPSSAIVRFGALTGVYKLMDNHRVSLQWIRLGENYGEKVCVISGLDEGTQIVDQPSKKLRDGVSVVIK